MIEALKLAAEAFHRRLNTTGINSWDAEAFAKCKAAIKAETGEVWDGRKWCKPGEW